MKLSLNIKQTAISRVHNNKRTGPQVDYGDNIDYTIHPKWAFFNSFAGVAVNRSVQSDVRKNVSPSGKSLDYGQDTPFYKQLGQYESQPDNKSGESEINPGLYIANLGSGDAVALVKTDTKNSFTDLAKQVANGKLDGISSRVLDNLKTAKSVLTNQEAHDLYAALRTNAKAKQNTYAAFIIKHPDSTSETPDYELAVAIFKPTGAFEFKSENDDKNSAPAGMHEIKNLSIEVREDKQSVPIIISGTFDAYVPNNLNEDTFSKIRPVDESAIIKGHQSGGGAQAPAKWSSYKDFYNALRNKAKQIDHSGYDSITTVAYSANGKVTVLLKSRSKRY